MTEVLQANIFFIITAFAVVVCTILVCIALFHIIKLLKSFRRIVARVEEGADAISEDMHTLRTQMAEGGVVQKFFRFLFTRTKSSHNDKKNSTRRKEVLKIKDES